jgi:hypothetical protein
MIKKNEWMDLDAWMNGIFNSKDYNIPPSLYQNDDGYTQKI